MRYNHPACEFVLKLESNDAYKNGGPRRRTTLKVRVSHSIEQLKTGYGLTSTKATHLCCENLFYY